MVVNSNFRFPLVKISLIICLIASTVSTLLSQDKMEYRDGAVLCNQEHSDHDLKVYLTESYELEQVNVSILGEYEKVDGRLRFTPLIPFQKGQKYLAFCSTNKLEFKVPLPEDYVNPSVVKIYPSADTLPSNLLKFHLHFSRPMSRIGYTNVELLDGNGKTIERAILKEIPELWNDDHVQLTIWIEPGRIKRGLGPNVELGPVLEENNSYSLFISGRFRDENGVELDQDYVKKFVAGEADREKLNVDEVVTKYHSEDKSNYLTVKFGEAVDFSSSIANLSIQGSSTQVIKGSWQLTNEDTEAIFTPESKLEKGHYEVLLNSVIEDLAGNNFVRNFDQEINEKLERDSKKQFRVSFDIE